MTRGGLPHSDIFGSKLVCSSPGLFAACHVLHRLLAPRHSPYTLSSLTIRNSKLTLTNRLHVSWSATVPLLTLLASGNSPPPHRRRLIVARRLTRQRNVAKTCRQTLCSEKNYRLQDIQLSKSASTPAGLQRGRARDCVASLVKLQSFSNGPAGRPCCLACQP